MFGKRQKIKELTPIQVFLRSDWDCSSTSSSLLEPKSSRWNCIWWTADLKYLEFDFNSDWVYIIPTLFHYLPSRLLNRIPSSLWSFPKQHVSMCYNRAGKQKKNWLMRGAVAILTHKARPQNIPWLWRGKAQPCFSWQREVYSQSWTSFVWPRPAGLTYMEA